MKPLKVSEFSPLLSDRARLVIMSTLAAHPKAMEFNEILETAGLTKGNLSCHMRRLEEAGYVSVCKEFVERKPKTTYACTRIGREEIKSHLRAIETVLKSVLKK